MQFWCLSETPKFNKGGQGTLLTSRPCRPALSVYGDSRMDLMTIITFVALSYSFCAIPGPNVLVVVSTSLGEGKLRGFETTIGVSAAMATQLAIAALGASWFVQALAGGFFWLKWCGVAYLAYLGVKSFKSLFSSSSSVQTSTAVGTFSRGFFVSLTNPKTILFFAAFLPQFAVPTSAFPLQIAILSAIFWLVALTVNLGYVLLASRISEHLSSERRSKIIHGTSGALYIGASAMLAAVKRS